MIKAVELYEASKLPIFDVFGNPINADFMADNDNRNKIVKSVSTDGDFNIIVELEEE